MWTFKVRPILIALMCVGLVGCHAKQNASPAEEVDNKTWELADHSEKVLGWVSGDNHAGKRSWIWLDAKKSPASYRITGGGQSGQWKTMDRITVSEDANQTISPDPNGKYGAAEMLPSGKYGVEYKVGEEMLTGITLKVD